MTERIGRTMLICGCCGLTTTKLRTVKFEVRKGGAMYRAANFIKRSNGKVYDRSVAMCEQCAREAEKQ